MKKTLAAAITALVLVFTVLGAVTAPAQAGYGKVNDQRGDAKQGFRGDIKKMGVNYGRKTLVIKANFYDQPGNVHSWNIRVPGKKQPVLWMGWSDEEASGSELRSLVVATWRNRDYSGSSKCVLKRGVSFSAKEHYDAKQMTLRVPVKCLRVGKSVPRSLKVQMTMGNFASSIDGDLDRTKYTKPVRRN